MVRQATALAAALAITFASVVDNAACCREDGAFETAPGGPSAPAPGCSEMPCHTPLLPSAVACPAPVLTRGRDVFSPYVVPASADELPPPTPPPDRA